VAVSSGPLGTAVTDVHGHDLREAAVPKQIAELTSAIKPRDHRVFFGALNRARLCFPGSLVARLPAFPGVEGDFRAWADVEAWAQSIAHELARVRRGAHCRPPTPEAAEWSVAKTSNDLDAWTGGRRHGSGYAAPDTRVSRGCSGSGRGGRPRMRVSASIQRDAAPTRDEPVPQGVALITGCSTGIGRGTAAMLTSAGLRARVSAIRIHDLGRLGTHAARPRRREPALAPPTHRHDSSHSNPTACAAAHPGQARVGPGSPVLCRLA
jgi:hypothetical protein